jgi:hypothetical protein
VCAFLSWVSFIDAIVDNVDDSLANVRSSRAARAALAADLQGWGEEASKADAASFLKSIVKTASRAARPGRFSPHHDLLQIYQGTAFLFVFFFFFASL